jgi:hypothetical protein
MADASAKALEASVSTDIIGDNSSQNSDKLLSASSNADKFSRSPIKANELATQVF